jgi:hypothetical protein
MLTHILIALYPIIMIMLVAVVFRYFKIRQHLSLNVPDVVTFLLIFGLHRFSKAIVNISILPYFFMIISAMALILLLLDLFYYRDFSAKKFTKFFWRVTFFITLLLYICMVIVIFTK